MASGALGFTHRGFERAIFGKTRDEIRALLGEPDSRIEANAWRGLRETWYYGPDRLFVRWEAGPFVFDRVGIVFTRAGRAYQYHMPKDASWPGIKGTTVPNYPFLGPLVALAVALAPAPALAAALMAASAAPDDVPMRYVLDASLLIARFDIFAWAWGGLIAGFVARRRRADKSFDVEYLSHRKWFFAVYVIAVPIILFMPAGYLAAFILLAVHCRLATAHAQAFETNQHDARVRAACFAFVFSLLAMHLLARMHAPLAPFLGWPPWNETLATVTWIFAFHLFVPVCRRHLDRLEVSLILAVSRIRRLSNMTAKRIGDYFNQMMIDAAEERPGRAIFRLDHLIGLIFLIIWFLRIFGAADDHVWNSPPAWMPRFQTEATALALAEAIPVAVLVLHWIVFRSRFLAFVRFIFFYPFMIVAVAGPVYVAALVLIASRAVLGFFLFPLILLRTYWRAGELIEDFESNRRGPWFTYLAKFAMPGLLVLVGNAPLLHGRPTIQTFIVAILYIALGFIEKRSQRAAREEEPVSSATESGASQRASADSQERSKSPST